ncbi:hypothetical protein NDA07_15035 [Microcoleus vaginatus DQ-U2]|nr:hypothetical protein [Microcoleus sp. FACHB-DQ6]
MSRKIKAFSEDLAKEMPPPKKRGVWDWGSALLLENGQHPHGVTARSVTSFLTIV